MAAKHGAHSRLNAPKATQAPMVGKHAGKRGPQARVGLGGISHGQQRAGGGDDVLLGDKARDGQRCCLPGAKAKRGEDPGDQVAEHGKHGVVHELLGDAVHRGQVAKGTVVATKVGQEPNHDSRREDDRAGLLVKAQQRSHTCSAQERIAGKW